MALPFKTALALRVSARAGWSFRPRAGLCCMNRGPDSPLDPRRLLLSMQSGIHDYDDPALLQWSALLLPLRHLHPPSLHTSGARAS